MRYNFLLAVCIWVICLGCKKDILFDYGNNGGILANAPKLQDLPFPFGAAINVDLVKNNADYRAIVLREYNSITLENAMKAGFLHPAKDFYNWQQADEMVKLAQDHQKKVHGHTLIWHSDIPQWIKDFNGNQEAWEQLFKSHIQTIVSHYKGKVKSWDVVNEAFEDDGTLRRSIWYEKLGSDYIARAFMYAHEADPSALLFYNDYGQEYSDEGRANKGVAIAALASELIKRNIPIHGLGLQMHTRYTQADDDLARAITLAASTGLKIHISELDVALNTSYDPNLTHSMNLEEQQALKYKAIVRIYNQLPAHQKFGITTWNVGDADSWVPAFFKVPDWPTLFNAEYKKKLAYQAVLDAVK